MARITLEISVDLDDVPGTFSTPESAKHSIQIILGNQIGHYHPLVTLPNK